YIEVRGRRYSVPTDLAGRLVQIRLTLDGALAVYDGEQLVASHRVVPHAPGWVTLDNRWPSTRRWHHDGAQCPPRPAEDGAPAHPARWHLCAGSQRRPRLPRVSGSGVEAEWRRRQQRGIESRLRLARFPWIKTWISSTLSFSRRSIGRWCASWQG